jgi:hypothetical protein
VFDQSLERLEQQQRHVGRHHQKRAGGGTGSTCLEHGVTGSEAFALLDDRDVVAGDRANSVGVGPHHEDHPVGERSGQSERVRDERPPAERM